MKIFSEVLFEVVFEGNGGAPMARGLGHKLLPAHILWYVCLYGVSL